MRQASFLSYPLAGLEPGCLEAPKPPVLRGAGLLSGAHSCLSASTTWAMSGLSGARERCRVEGSFAAELGFSEEAKTLNCVSLTGVHHTKDRKSFRLLIFFLRGKALNAKYIYFSY